MTEPPPLPSARRAVSVWRLAIELVVAVSLGFFVWLLPYAVGLHREPGEWWVPFFALCVVFGFASRVSWLITGFATIVTLPLFAIFEMASDRTSHNLWPIEFVSYVVIGFVASLAMAGGRLLRRELPRRSESPRP